MLVNETENTCESFLEIFNKKFSSFCQKAPCLLEFKADLEKVIIKEEYTGKVFTYSFDHSIDVKTNIKNIKDWLIENCYPVMIHNKREFEEYTPEEIEKIIKNQDISVEQASIMKKEIKTEIKHRIEKVIIQKDEFFVKNLDTGKTFRFQLFGIPCSIFLSKMRSEWSPSYAYEMFAKKSKLLNQIYEIDDKGNFIKE